LEIIILAYYKHSYKKVPFYFLWLSFSFESESQIELSCSATMVVLQDLLSSQIAGRGVGGKKKRGVRGKGISRGAAGAKWVKRGVR
jgi:hypothetical protein